MNKINFVNNSEPALSAETLNQIQNNMEEVGVAVSSTEPTTNEKVWIDNENNVIKAKNDSGEFTTIYDKKDFVPKSYDEQQIGSHLHFYKLDKMVFVNGLYSINSAQKSFKVPYNPIEQVRFPVTSANADETPNSNVGRGIITQDGNCSISMTGAVTYAYMSFCYQTY